MDDHNNIFTERCKLNPQGVIDDLVAQTTRQAQAIGGLISLTESVLEPAEASYLLDRLLLNDDEMGLKIIKKLQIIENVDKENKKNKKKKNVKN